MRYYKFANVSQFGPLRELNSGMCIEQTIGHAMPRLAPSAKREDRARSASTRNGARVARGISSIYIFLAVNVYVCLCVRPCVLPSQNVTFANISETVQLRELNFGT